MIKVRNLQKSFGDNHVLNGIDVDIRKGECVCVIGPSGSGKSTFLRCLNLLEKPEEGEIYINGQDIMDPKLNVDKYRENLGMVFQHFNLFPNMTDETASNLFQECDLYLDINYGNELFNAIRRSFEQSMVLLAFEETVHNKDYIPQQHVFTKDKVEFMVEKIQHMVREQSYWQKCLTEQYNSLRLGNKDGYKKQIDPNGF